MANRPKNLTADQEKILVKAVRRSAASKDFQYWFDFLRDLVINNAIPIDLLKDIPLKAGKVGKTRFDQVYAASMFLAFPGYRERTLKQLLGPRVEINHKTKIWKAIFPEKFKLAHILIRADSFQEAFALACDYGCRASLRLFKMIPTELTVKVRFVSEIGIRKKLGLSSANKLLKQKNLRLVAKEFTPKQINGARLFALGIHGTDEYSIAKYSEWKDLRQIKNFKQLSRVSSVELELHKDVYELHPKKSDS